MPKLNLEGTFTALITPFKANGEVDYEAFSELVDTQIAKGVNGLVPIGTTGESPTLTKEEKKKIFSMCVEKCKGKNVLVVAGTGSNDTASTVENTQEAKKLGVDAALVVVPYYNKPNQAGQYEHFKKVASEGGLPIILYNIPGRCGVQLNADTVAKLAKDCPNVVGIKESTGNLDMSTEIASLCDIQILSGDDSLTLPIISVGGKGVISVLSNFAPELVRAIVEPAIKGDFKTAGEAHRRAFKLIKTMFIEPNPQPCKAAMSMLGMIDDSLRLPMVPAASETRAKVAAVLKEYGFEAGDGQGKSRKRNGGSSSASPAKKSKA